MFNDFFRNGRKQTITKTTEKKANGEVFVHEVVEENGKRDEKKYQLGNGTKPFLLLKYEYFTKGGEKIYAVEGSETAEPKKKSGTKYSKR